MALTPAVHTRNRAGAARQHTAGHAVWSTVGFQGSTVAITETTDTVSPTKVSK